jgi:membrane AbrB-like protein
MLNDNAMNMMIYLVCAFFGGFIGYKTRIPAGTLIFSLAAVASVRLLRVDGGSLPGYMNFVSQTLVGLVIGAQFNQKALQVISRMWVYMLMSVFVLVVAGMIYGVIMVKINHINLPTAYLGTSPQGANVPLVAIFHITRVFFILLTGPMVLRLIEYLKM